jgi:hypothetical protein
VFAALAAPETLLRADSASTLAVKDPAQDAT